MDVYIQVHGACVKRVPFGDGERGEFAGLEFSDPGLKIRVRLIPRGKVLHVSHLSIFVIQIFARDKVRKNEKELKASSRREEEGRTKFK